VSSEAEENKALVRRFVEELDKGNLDVIDELLAPDFVDRSLLPGQAPDRESFKRSVAEMQAPFSNTNLTIDDQVAEGDKVVTWYTASSTHDRGPLMGVPPTGRRTTFTGVYLHRVVGGKIVEEWSQGDFLNIMLPALEQQMRERAEQELQVARRIQQASLPKAVPVLEGWEVANHYQPAREVGGDFYDFHLLSDGRLGLVVGDATGKGVPAALVMATTCGMLRAVAQALDSCSPGEVLERVDEALSPNIAANMFVTCFYAVLDPESGRLSYANAGHDLPYRKRVGHSQGAEELRATGMPLGLRGEGDSAGGGRERPVLQRRPRRGPRPLPRDVRLSAAAGAGRRARGRRRLARRSPITGALRLCRCGLGAGGRHHPRYPREVEGDMTTLKPPPVRRREQTVRRSQRAGSKLN
jgi:predicted ester cyclase